MILTMSLYYPALKEVSIKYYRTWDRNGGGMSPGKLLPKESEAIYSPLKEAVRNSTSGSATMRICWSFSVCYPSLRSLSDFTESLKREECVLVLGKNRQGRGVKTALSWGRATPRARGCGGQSHVTLNKPSCEGTIGAGAVPRPAAEPALPSRSPRSGQAPAAPGAAGYK